LFISHCSKGFHRPNWWSNWNWQFWWFHLQVIINPNLFLLLFLLHFRIFSFLTLLLIDCKCATVFCLFRFLYGDQARFFNDEIHIDLKHSKTGTVAMASAGENMNASQVLYCFVFLLAFLLFDLTTLYQTWLLFFLFLFSVLYNSTRWPWLPRRKAHSKYSRPHFLAFIASLITFNTLNYYTYSGFG
jgi:hypothetical protein